MTTKTRSSLRRADSVAALEDEVVGDLMAAVLRTKSPAERLAIGFGMWRSAERMVRAQIHSQHPDWSEEAVGRAVAQRLADGSW